MKFMSFIAPGVDFQADMSNWSTVFTDLDGGRWGAQTSGLLEFRDGPRRFMLMIARHEGTYSLGYACYNRDNKSAHRSLISVNHPERLTEVVFFADDTSYPVGSFLNPDDTVAAVAEFLRDPTEPPSSIVWIAADTPEA